MAYTKLWERKKEKEKKKCGNMKVEINALGETLNAEKPWVKMTPVFCVSGQDREQWIQIG